MARSLLICFLLSVFILSGATINYEEGTCVYRVDRIFPTFSETLSYPRLKTSIETKRKGLQLQYDNAYHKDTIITLARELWINAIGTAFYRHWQNTPWDFNGTTTMPRQGVIACGFFVTTLLQDMGLSINRRELAVCASLQMMRKLL